MSCQRIDLTTPQPSFFVAGATGYTGQAVVAAAAQQRIPVVAHIRPNSIAGERLHPDFINRGAHVESCPWHDATIHNALQRHQPSHIFALLGTTRARSRAERRAGQSPSTYATVDVALTVKLMQAAQQLQKPPTFIYLSSMGAGSPRPNAYLAARQQVEQALQESQLPWIIARPSFISGPNRDQRRIGERVGAVFTDKTLSVLGALGASRLRQRFRSITNHQLAHALIRLALNPDATNQIHESNALQQLIGGQHNAC